MEIEALFQDKHSDVSHFSNETNDNGSWLKNENSKENDMNKYMLTAFSKLVDNRKNYLKQLLNLPENWISGESNIPNQYSIDAGQKILTGFLKYLRLKLMREEYVFIPKLIIGPIPSGGIGIELHRDSEIALYFTIINNKNIEVEM
jgi:hypothetical protein